MGTPRVFDLVAEAQRAADSGELDRIHNIMLASAGIPGAFPFRIIDGELYVDGGVTGNIIYGGRIAEEDSLPALWQKAYPNLPIPKFRFWVIFNNQFRPLPVVVAPNWLAVIQRSLETSTRAATATAVRHLFAMAEISKLKRNADVEVRVVSIPPDWSPPVPGVFKKETMNSLADLGEKMGADPASWSDKPWEFCTSTLLVSKDQSPLGLKSVKKQSTSNTPSNSNQPDTRMSSQRRYATSYKMRNEHFIPNIVSQSKCFIYLYFFGSVRKMSECFTQ